MMQSRSMSLVEAITNTIVKTLAASSNGSTSRNPMVVTVVTVW
jgi:hypothetical protein